MVEFSMRNIFLWVKTTPKWNMLTPKGTCKGKQHSVPKSGNLYISHLMSSQQCLVKKILFIPLSQMM